MSTSGNPKIQRAIDCISAVPAEKLGAGSVIRGNEYWCSIGHLMGCAGVTPTEIRDRMHESIPFTEYPELDEIYGIDVSIAWQLACINDNNHEAHIDRKEEVLSFLRGLL